MSRNVVVLGLAISVLGTLPMLLTGALAVQIRAEMEFDATGIGLGVSGFFAAGAVVSIWLGRLVERLGGRNGLRLAGTLAGISLVGVGVLAQSLASFVALLAIGGCANAAAHPSSNLLLLRGVRAGRRGVVFGVKQSAIPLAGFLGGLAVPTVALTAGWRWAFIGAGVIAFVVSAVIPRRLESIAPAHSPSRKHASGFGHARAPLTVVAAAAGLGAGAATPLAGFLTTTHVEAGIAEGTAGLLFAISSAAGVGSRVLMGWLADRYESWRLGAVGGLLMIGGGSFALLAASQITTVVLGSVLAYGAGWGWPGLLNYSVAASQDHQPAAATGFVQTGIYSGAAIGPLGFGIVADTTSLGVSWSIVAGAAFAGGVLMLIGHRWLQQRTSQSAA